MKYIRGGNGNPDDYDSRFAKKLNAILKEIMAEIEQEKKIDYNKLTPTDFPYNKCLEIVGAHIEKG